MIFVPSKLQLINFFYCQITCLKQDWFKFDVFNIKAVYQTAAYPEICKLRDKIVMFLDETRYTITKSALYTSLKNAQLESFKETLVALFGSIPYNNYVNNTISSYEGYFASVIYAYLASLGLDITAEDVTSRGRIDLTVKLADNIYILEFKVDGNGGALQQIKEKDYQRKYLTESKNIFLIGIDFNSDEKNISNFEWELIE